VSHELASNCPNCVADSLLTNRLIIILKQCGLIVTLFFVILIHIYVTNQRYISWAWDIQYQAPRLTCRRQTRFHDQIYIENFDAAQANVERRSK